jgi:hypothetical protein
MRAAQPYGVPSHRGVTEAHRRRPVARVLTVNAIVQQLRQLLECLLLGDPATQQGHPLSAMTAMPQFPIRVGSNSLHVDSFLSQG